MLYLIEFINKTDGQEIDKSDSNFQETHEVFDRNDELLGSDIGVLQSMLEKVECEREGIDSRRRASSLQAHLTSDIVVDEIEGQSNPSREKSSTSQA